jgi:superfamily II DNA helicase RecQ
MYDFCPIGGIVCLDCKYPIKTHDGYVKEVAKHERNNNNHGDVLNYEARVALLQAFQSYNNELAKRIVTALPDKVMATNIILEEIDAVKSYNYCTECRALVYDSKLHKSNTHVKWCKEKRDGYASKYWTNKNPRILPSTFTLDDISHLSTALQEALRNEIRRQNKMSLFDVSITDRKSLAYKQLLFNQEAVFFQQDECIALRCIEVNKNPDLWLLRTGWDNYLKGFTASDIHKITIPFDATTEEHHMQLEINFAQAVKDQVGYVRNIDRLHQIFYEVQRQPNKPYPSKPFLVPSDTTYERYISDIRMIFRIIVRVFDHQKHDSISTKYPNISFSKQQSDIIDTIFQQPQALQNYIDLLFALAAQTYVSHPYQCTLICALAIMSLKPDGTFKPPEQFTGTYAAVLAVYKVLVIQRSMSEASEETSSIDLAKLYTQKHLSHPVDIQQHPNVMSYIINVLSYAFAITRNSPVKGYIAWSDHVLIYQNVRLSMIDFRSAISQNLKNAEKLLQVLCEVKAMKDLPVIPWDSTYDDINNSSYNYSFISEPKNSYIETSKIFNSQRNTHLWIDDNGSFDMNHVTHFKKTVKAFLEVLLCLIHVCGGQPARGTEIIILQHTNSSSSSICSRSIYIDRGLVCIFTRYHKNVLKMNHTKDIFRFLPPRIGNLLVYYLWLVLPFYQNVVGSCEQKQFKSTYLWTDNIVDTNDSTRTWDSNKLTSQLNKFFMTKVGTDMNISKYRHISIAIVRKYLSLHITVKTSGLNEDELETDEVDDCIWDLQAGHATSTALNVYARTISENNLSSQSLLDKYRFISLLWHDFIFQEGKINLTTSDALSKTLYNQRLNRFVRLKTIPPSKMLQNFIGPDATFRGNQEEVITAISEGKQCILQIAGTGVGKSMSFMLPAYTTLSGTSIVVVPLKALQHDLVSRCSKQCIIARIWNEDECYNDANLVFVTPESASSPKFLDFINSLLIQHQLDRIFIDECHLLLSNSNTFRKKMDDLKTAIKVANVQLIMLTATLPIKCEQELFKRLDISHTVLVCRDVTTRRNIAYKVLQSSQRYFMNHLQQIIASFDNGRCIVYARSLLLGKQLADGLLCDHYHSQAENKKQIYDRWVASENVPIVVATSALGCGVDVPDIRYVVHVGLPGTLCDFAQESGRAGRDGKKAFSYLIHIEEMKYKVDDSDMLQYISSSQCRRCILDATMDGNNDRKYCGLNEEMCDLCERRKISEDLLEDVDMSLFDFDGNTSSNNANHDISADIQVILHMEEHLQKRQRTDNIEKSVITYSLKETLDSLAEATCLVCKLNKCTRCVSQKHHQLMKDQARQRTMRFMGNYRQVRYKLPNYIVCFQCFCPQDICMEKMGAKIDCKHKFVMLDTIYLIAILDNSFNRHEFDDINYMLDMVRNYAAYSQMINLVKVFMDTVSAYQTNK